MMKIIGAFIFSFFLLSCASQNNASLKSIRRLTFIGEYLLPDKTDFRRTRVGGLSSIDYNPTEGLYYFISDDRSDSAPARYYTAKVFLSAKGIDSLRFVNVVSLLQKTAGFIQTKDRILYTYPTRRDCV